MNGWWSTISVFGVKGEEETFIGSVTSKSPNYCNNPKTFNFPGMTINMLRFTTDRGGLWVGDVSIDFTE